ncbi:lipase family protein [Listeria rustica]|uniref:Lipase n=1 Tax=Listeria rustica TaxID=2713503 RepID=A0A7W1T4R3_9LIST|nr:lipase [Listeria rustica]MBA3925448.1 lipase [Listeria rustica]
MKLSDETYFNLSKIAYENDYLKIGKTIRTGEGDYYKVVNSIDGDSGLQAICVVTLREYQDYNAGKTKSYNNMVFVSRGTEPAKLKDVKAGVGLLTSKTEGQFDDYDRFVHSTLKKYDVKDYSFTGHSLGGALAQYEAVKHTKPATTFAAARAYNKLTDAEQAKAKKGDYWNLIKDLRHQDDVVGSLPPNALLFYPTYFMERNQSASLLDKAGIGGHLAGTFEGCFGANGSAEMLYKPDDIRRLGTSIQQLGTDCLSDVERFLISFRNEQELRMQELKSKYLGRLSGDLNLLTEYEIEDALHDVAQSKSNGVPVVFNTDMLENVLEQLKHEKVAWQDFGRRIVDAGNSIERNDGELAHILKTDLSAMMRS